jgi:hypothetical protein
VIVVEGTSHRFMSGSWSDSQVELEPLWVVLSMTVLMKDEMGGTRESVDGL